MPFQQSDKISFGTGRLFTNQPGGQRLKVGDIQDVSVDFKIELKEIYGENSFPIAVAQGHRSIDITCKHWTFALAPLAGDLAAGSVQGSENNFVIDEVFTATAGTATLASSGYIDKSLDLVRIKSTAGIIALSTYSVVPAGSEVVGKSASINASTGAVAFASGDSGAQFKASYQIPNIAGTSINISNVQQNAVTPYSLVLVKRDVSPVDGSSGQLIMTFNAVLPGGFKMTTKEGEFSEYERMFKAFSDGAGNVASIQFVNV